MNLPPPDDIADRLLVKTLEAEVTQAQENLTRREQRLSKALSAIYDGHSPSHDERPVKPDLGLPRVIHMICIGAIIIGGFSIAYSIWTMIGGN